MGDPTNKTTEEQVQLENELLEILGDEEEIDEENFVEIEQERSASSQL